MWVGGLADSQTRSKPPKSSFLTEISPFVFPNLTKTLGWENTFGKDLPKKTVFYTFPKTDRLNCNPIYDFVYHSCSMSIAHATHFQEQRLR